MSLFSFGEDVLKSLFTVFDFQGSNTFDTTFSLSPTDIVGVNTMSDFPTDSIIASTTSATSASTSSNTGTIGEFLLRKGLNEKLIPIYCSILAAVVVGLVAFIIFKR